MMPLAPNPIMAMPTSKPKIGFSIESIVGENSKEGKFTKSDEEQEILSKPVLADYYKANEQLSDLRFPNSIEKALRFRTCSPEKANDNYDQYNPHTSPAKISLTRTVSEENEENVRTRTDIINRTPSPQYSTNCSKNSPEFTGTSLLSASKIPLLVPGISPGYMVPYSRHDFKPITSYTTDITSQHNSQMLAAQITAAALSSSTFPPIHQQSNHLHGSTIARDSYPLYPWLISRHGRIFPHRFPGSMYILFIWLFKIMSVQYIKPIRSYSFALHSESF